VTFVTPKTWAAGEVLSADDMNVYVRDNTLAMSIGSRRIITRIFSTAGTATFSKADPLGDGSLDGALIKQYRVIAIGGGGAGGGGLATSANQASVASGGQSGGYAERFVLPSQFDATITITVGAGGAAASGAAGGDGGDSSFGSTTSSPSVVARGGRGGFVSTAKTGFVASNNTWRGLTNGVGAFWFHGQSGQGAVYFGNEVTGLAGGNGGSSLFGTGGSGINAATDASLATGQRYGGGGGGVSQILPSASAATGGAGAAGVVLVEMFANPSSAG
jgi:hypothetical protein